MKIENEFELKIDFTGGYYTIEQQKEKAKKINEIYSKILNDYKEAESPEEFENLFFVFWYREDESRFFLFHIIESIFQHHNIITPEFYLKDKILFENFELTQNSIQKKEVEQDSKDDYKYLFDRIEIGEGVLEVFTNKPIDLKEHLRREVKRKEEQKIHQTLLEKAEEQLSSSNSFKEYLFGIKSFFYEMYNSNFTLIIFECIRRNIMYGIPLTHLPEWVKEVPKVPAFTLTTRDTFSEKEIKTIMREEELLKYYENDKYILKTLIFSIDYDIEERERLIKEFINHLKNKNEIYDFVSNSVERQVRAFMEKLKQMKNALDIHKEEKITIYEDLIKEIEASGLENKEKEKIIRKYENEIEILNSDLIELNIEYLIYYPEYERIKNNESPVSKEEKKFVMDLGFNKKIDSWEFAFYVLAFRKRNNSHFLSLFNDANDPININSLNSLEYYFDNFNNQHNKYQNRKNSKNQNKVNKKR